MSRPVLSRVFAYYLLSAAFLSIIFYSLWISRESVVHLAYAKVGGHEGGAKHEGVVESVQTHEPVPTYEPTPTHAPVATDEPTHTPEPTYTGIPKKIWYKLGPHGISPDIRAWTDTCIHQNPDYQVRFLDDSSDDDYVRTAFSSRPDIVEMYLGLNVPIFKADILRYLLLYDQGGIWSDLDISCEGIPIDSWIPAEYKDSAGLVVGWEFDWGWPGKYVRQFTSWTIMSRPKSPHLMQVIDDILSALHQKLDEHNTTIPNATLTMIGDVVDFSGPRRLTFGVYKSLGKMLNRTVDESDFRAILKPKLLGDVLVLPGKSFAASSNTYSEEEEGVLGPRLVTHHYAGTWKNEKGGEKRRGLRV
jgi:alpha 1,6-mannosyltransferase